MDSKKLIHQKAKTNLERMAAADPITWKAVLKLVGKALAKAILSKIFESLFKNDVNYQDLIKNLLQNIDRIIELRIDEAFIKQSVNKMGSIQDAMFDYLNQPSTERLNDIEQGSRELINSFESYGHRCYKEYLLTIPFRVFALEEYLKSGRNEEMNIVKVLNDAIKHVRKLDAGWKAINDNRYSVKWESTYLPEPGTPPGGININFMDTNEQKNGYFVGAHWVEKDGKRISNYYSWSDHKKGSYDNAKKESEAHLIRLRNVGYQIDYVEELINPASEAIVEWEKRIAQLK